jgi:arylsulfatase A-like enzyme
VIFRLFGVATLIAGMIVQHARVVAQGGVSQVARRPNMVLIIMDDLGYGDIGSYGVKDARTPNLDRLAREGVRLTDAYSNGANCSPTRSALISGRYQQRVGIERPLNTTNDLDRGLPVTGASLPALLKKNGYATGLVGKWHLGVKPEFGPNAHGFDEFFGLLSGAVDYYTHRRGDGTHDLFDNTTPVEVPGYLTDEITNRAVSFIDRRAADPFFLEVAYNAVHWPYQPPGRPPSDRNAVPRPAQTGDARLYQGPDDLAPATRQDYVRMLERADEGIGRILAALDRQGLSRNTLVMFTSDNGGEWLSRNTPLSHRKSALWEGGIRVPLILRWPARLPVGKTSEQVAITMDLTATILAATATAAPPGHHPEGIDLLPILRGDSSLADRRLFWRIAGPNRQQRAVRAGRWKLLVDGGQFLLFDLRADPGEKQDLAAQRPEMVVKLKTLVEAWEKDVDQRP